MLLNRTMSQTESNNALFASWATAGKKKRKMLALQCSVYHGIVPGMGQSDDRQCWWWKMTHCWRVGQNTSTILRTLGLGEGKGVMARCKKKLKIEKIVFLFVPPITESEGKKVLVKVPWWGSLGRGSTVWRPLNGGGWARNAECVWAVLAQGWNEDLSLWLQLLPETAID